MDEATKQAGQAEWRKRLSKAMDELSPHGNGWWHQQGRKAVEAALETLIEHGVSPDEAVDLLGGVINAARD